MSVKRKIDSDDFIKGLNSAFAPMKEAVEPIGKEIKEINDKFTNTVKKELKPVIDKFETKFAPSIDKVKDAYSEVKEYVKSEKGQKEILNTLVEYDKAYRAKYPEYFALKEQVKKSYPNARVSFDIERDEFISKVGLNDYKTVEVKTRDGEFKVRYYPKTGEIKTIVPKKDEGSWFDAGAFEDGFDWKDIPDVLIGTSADVALGIEQGIGRLAEGVVDLGTYGISGAQKLFGNDKAAKKTKEFAQRNLVDELTNDLDEEISELSILGEKADNVTEGLGQTTGIILTGGAAGAATGGSAAAATAATTALTGASSMGNGITEAYLGGANDKEAFKYGIRKGAIDAGTELLFGGLGKASNAIGIGKGIGGFDDMLAKAIGKKVAGGIKNPTVQRVAMNTIEGLIKSGGEGAEELLSGYLTAHAKKDTYLTEEDFSKILKDENIGEQFWNSFITSIIAQAPSNIKSTVKGQDIITGLTDNEQKVFDKVYKEAIGDAETGGRKLTGKEKAKIYGEVLEKFKKGDVSSESIEAALGGEEYKAYKNVLRGYTVLQKELSEIESIDKNVKTKEQTTRQIQLRKELSELKNKAVEIKQDLQNKVLEKIDVDNIRLKNRESYLGSGYKKEFQDKANENLYKVKQSQKIDEKAFVDGLWGKDEKLTHNDSAENVENSQFESVENVSEDDIIRMAKEYLRSPEGQRDKRPYLRHRPSFGKNQEQIVYDSGKNIFGNVYDPSGAKVPWDPSKPRKGQWDMGHIPGQKYSVVHARYVKEMMTPAEFVQWYRNPKNYRPELPSTNRSHKYE